MRAQHRNREQGAAVVEFAVLIGLLLLFLVGIVEFGFLWWGSNFIANVAREGARVASKIEGTATENVNEREAAAKEAVETYLRTNSLLSSLIDDEPGFLTTTYTRDPEQTVAVDVNNDDIDDDLIMAEVTVTIQSHMIWEPMLWPLLSILIPGVNYDANKLRELTQTASFSTGEVIINE